MEKKIYLQKDDTEHIYDGRICMGKENEKPDE